MTIVNIVSALGDNRSIYPLLLRDCGIENTAKCAMTYTQNAKKSKLIAKEATRERIIEEYGTSAIWLGGIPVLNKIANKIIKVKGLDPNLNIKLFKNNGIQGLEENIKKFAELAPNEVATLKKAKSLKNKYINSQIQKFLFTTTIPIAIMGFLLPKLNYSYTKNKLNKERNTYKLNTPKMNEFMSQTKRKQISFTGLDALANMSDLNKMMILDGGLTVGRIKNSRNKAEKLETLFKMTGMCFLNYIAPQKIENFLNKITKAIFKVDTSLDIKLLDSKDFIKSIKENTLNLPKGLDEKSIIDFIDSNPTTIFTKECKKLSLVKFLNNNVRDPRDYVDTKKIADLKTAIEDFIKNAANSGSIENYAKKAIYAKSFNTFLNIGISSFLLAIMLPKLQFLFRKIITGTELDPGIQEVLK